MNPLYFLNEKGKRLLRKLLVFFMAIAVFILLVAIANAQTVYLPQRQYQVHMQPQLVPSYQWQNRAVAVPQTVYQPYQTVWGIRPYYRWGLFSGWRVRYRPSYVLQPVVQPQAVQQPCPIQRPQSQPDMTPVE